MLLNNRNLSIRCTCVCIKDNHGDQKQAATMFSYYYLFKEMVYNAGETDTQTRTYDPPITSRCRFLNCWKLNNNSMAHEGDGRSSDSNENAILSETKINISNGDA